MTRACCVLTVVANSPRFTPRIQAGQRLHGVVKTGFLDCDVHTAFCNQMGVTAYPLIRFFGPHKPELQAEFPNEMWQHRQVCVSTATYP